MCELQENNDNEKGKIMKIILESESGVSIPAKILRSMNAKEVVLFLLEYGQTNLKLENIHPIYVTDLEQAISVKLTLILEV